MNSTQLMAEADSNNSTSLIGFVINKIIGIIVNSIIGIIPLNYCVRKIVGGASTLSIFGNCALDIIALIPIFTPFVVAFRLGLSTVSSALKYITKIFNIISKIFNFIFGSSNNSTST